MIEIFINESDWKSPERAGRLAHIIDSLRNSGWERFGHSGAILLFKSTDKDTAKAELEKLKISEVEPEDWDEEIDF